MRVDDPNGPEIASWRSYTNFAGRVRHKRRFVWEREVTAFLDTILAAVRNRDRIIPEKSILYRAQHGINCYKDADGPRPIHSVGNPTDRRGQKEIECAWA